MESNKDEIMRDFDEFNLKSAAETSLFLFWGWLTVASVMAFLAGELDAEALDRLVGVMGMCTFPFFQLFWFGPRVVRRASYGLRVAGFGLTYLPALVFSARLAGVMEGAPDTAWLAFGVVYLAILAAFSAYFQWRYRRLAGSYQAALDRYHAEREAEGKGDGEDGGTTP